MISDYTGLINMRRSNNNKLIKAIADAGYKMLSDVDPKDQTFLVECTKGHQYKSRKYNFIKGNHCRICAMERKRNAARDELEKIITAEGYTILNIDGNVGAQTTYNLICPNGHKWSSAYSNLYQGHRCPVCNNNRSFGEKVIFNVLHKEKLPFEYQYRISDENGSYHYLDFLVERPHERPLMIEYDGLQHFTEDSRQKIPKEAMKQQQIRDAFKNKYAYLHKWDLLRIPYSSDSVQKIILALQKKLNVNYDLSYPYTSNIFNINDVTTYYLTHSLAETSSKFNITGSTVLNWFKKRTGLSKEKYIEKHPKYKSSKSEDTAKYFLTHSLAETMSYTKVSRTSVSTYFEQTYGMSKLRYSIMINDYSKNHTLSETLSKFKLTKNELIIVQHNCIYKNKVL